MTTNDNIIRDKHGRPIIDQVRNPETYRKRFGESKGGDETPYNVRKAAELHLQDTMIHENDFDMKDIIPRCEHFTNTIGPSVVHVITRPMMERIRQAYLNYEDVSFYVDEDHIPGDVSFTDLITRSGLWPNQVFKRVGSSISFQYEKLIGDWLTVEMFKYASLTDERLQPLLDLIAGVNIEWITGNGMISSNGELPRMIDDDVPPYRTSHEDTLKIWAIIVPDSNHTQELFTIDTTESFQLKSAKIVACKYLTHPSNPRERQAFEFSGADFKANFTTVGNKHTLTYGSYLDAQNTALTRGTGEAAARTFKHLAIEFEEVPETNEDDE